MSTMSDKADTVSINSDSTDAVVSPAIACATVDDAHTQTQPQALRRRNPDTVHSANIKPKEIKVVPTSNQTQKQKRPGVPYLQAQVVHYKPRVSVLDKELTTVSYHGLINFLLLLLSATLIRLAIENYMKYGFLVSIPGTSISRRDWLASVAGFLSVGVAFFVALAIEKNAVPSKPNYANVSDEALRVGMDADEKRTVLMHLSNLAFVLVAPSCITYFAIFQPALGTAVMMSACIMFLKLYSLAATNFDLRRAYRLGDSGLKNDPLIFSRMENGRFVLNFKNKPADENPDSDTDVSSEPGSSSSSRDNRSENAVGGSADVAASDGSQDAASSNDLVGPRIPFDTRGSFSLNARAWADIPVGGDDRIDAKADALPRPRIRRRAATTAANVLRLVADSTDAAAATIRSTGNSAATITDGSAQSSNGKYPANRDTDALGSVTSTGSALFSADKSLVASDGSKAGPARGNARHRIHYLVAYPHNVSLRNFGYFWLAPTLCYQPSYPRISGPISKSFVAKRLSELVILCITMYVVIQQYAVPTLVGSVKAIDTRDGFWLSERVLKLSVISAIVWFLGFYALFHAGLNALAEVLRFADRAFYLDWWNSVDLAAYWREWNLPIHYFCKRHIMVPLVSAPLNLPVSAGVMVTFLFSAVMHELLFGIPTHCLKGYSFVGMMAQIPLIQLTQWLVRRRGPESGLGNAIFWISFCIVGQPLGVVQYYYTWVKNNP